MKSLFKQFLLILITAILIVGNISTNVNAEDLEDDVMEGEINDEPSAHNVIHYVVESKDSDYLSKYEYLFPSSMVSEIKKSISNEDSLFIDNDEEVIIKSTQINGPQEYHLTKSAGVFQGPSGKETYYNLNMSGVVKIMRSMGYDEENYPYWIRDDGCKMLGPYIIVAAAFSIRPRGTVIETSLGTALVCDTGGFASRNQTQLDIAVNW